MILHGRIAYAGGLLVAAALGCGGCAYRGAIYSSYQEGGIGIRTTAESSAPIKVHFGYDRSVAAFVPRRGGDAQSEEATSLISKDQVGANLNPTKITTADALMIDSAFITGTAAIVASAPDDATVTVNAAPGVPGASYVAIGSAGDRIGMALTQQPGRLTANQTTILRLNKQIAARTSHVVQNKIYTTAGLLMPPDFQGPYNARIASPEEPRTAFPVVQQDYLEDQPDDSVRYQQVQRALSAALEGN